MTVTATQIKRARQAGAFAGAAGLDAARCPYNPRGDADQRRLSLAWLRAYLAKKSDRGVSYSD